jgi:hypothetical protein
MPTLVVLRGSMRSQSYPQLVRFSVTEADLAKDRVDAGHLAACAGSSRNSAKGTLNNAYLG